MIHTLVDGKCTKCKNDQKNMEYNGVLTGEITSNSYKKCELTPDISFKFYCFECKEETMFEPIK